ncbi:MAG: hypothetical protein RSG59_04015 [Ruthenibacterium sp.]
MTKTEKTILRTLAAHYLECANSDQNLFNITAHRSVNDLQGARPIVLISEIPWHEMNIENELTLQCKQPVLREAEQFFRRELYKWKHMPADMVLPPYYSVQKIIHSTGCGLNASFNDETSKPGSQVASHLYEDQLRCFEDLEKLHNETITYDQTATVQQFECVADAIGDVIPVKITGIASGYETACKIWDDISTFKSLEDLLVGLIDEPEFMHAMADKLTDILLDKYRQYDALNLWNANAYDCHSTAALSNSLPCNAEHPTRKNIWGRGLAQILATVSPAMHAEFDTAYQIKALAGFGLVYYGCCEPLHHKIEKIEKIPNLRKISITPWADVDVAAEIIGKRYVLASKPNPAHFVGAAFDEAAARAELQRIVNACRRNSCSCDIVMKDISTVGGKPENLFRWQKIAMEEVERL